MGISRITRNYQVTIPKDVRRVKGLREGDTVLFAVSGDRVELVKMDEEVVRQAAGLWSDEREGGVAYVRRLRRAWAPRQRRLAR